MGDAIGARTGLVGYEKGIVEAHSRAHAAMLRQVFGAGLGFLAVRSKRIGIMWSPLFLVAFAVSTFVICTVIVGVAEIIQSWH
jgi:hypothetical protein